MIGKNPNNTSNLPSYIKGIYPNVYNNAKWAKWLDNVIVYQTILFLNGFRLIKLYLEHIPTNAKMYQISSVYGPLLKRVANKIGEYGKLDIVDLLKVQCDRAKIKVGHLQNVTITQQDGRIKNENKYDVIGMFFLLHEVPTDVKKELLEKFLEHVDKGAKGIIIDYHNPAIWNPFRYILWVINNTMEPHVEELWENSIDSFAENSNKYNWEKTNIFGKAYQRVIVTKK